MVSALSLELKFTSFFPSKRGSKLTIFPWLSSTWNLPQEPDYLRLEITFGCNSACITNLVVVYNNIHAVLLGMSIFNCECFFLQINKVPDDVHIPKGKYPIFFYGTHET